jgi:hypothetical protein
MNRSFTSRTMSMTPGTWWSGLGGLSRFRTLWILNRIRAWNHFARRNLLGGLEILTFWVNFWFHSDFEAHQLWIHILERRDLGYPQPLGSRHLSQEPSQRSLERYHVGLCMTGEVRKTRHKGRFMLSLPVGSAEIEPSLILSRGFGAGEGLGARSLILISDALFLTSFQGFF